MSSLTPNMSLIRWDSPTDTFASGDLVSNANLIDNHAHIPGQGVQIPTAGLQNQSVTNGKLAAGAVTSDKVANAGVTTANYTDLSVTAGKLADGSVTLTKLGGDTVSQYDPAFLNYKPIVERSLAFAGGTVTGNYFLTSNNLSTGLIPFFLDSVDFAAGTRTVRLKVRLEVQTNAVAPNTDISLSLYQVTVGAISGSTPASTVSGLSIVSTTITAATLTTNNTFVGDSLENFYPTNGSPTLAGNGIALPFFALVANFGSNSTAGSNCIVRGTVGYRQRTGGLLIP